MDRVQLIIKRLYAIVSFTRKFIFQMFATTETSGVLVILVLLLFPEVLGHLSMQVF